MINKSPQVTSASRAQVYEVLMDRGWIQNIDYFFLAVEVALPVFLYYRDLTAVVILLASILVTALWLLVMAFRLSYNVIVIQSNLDAMPANSARLAAKFLRGTSGA